MSKWNELPTETLLSIISYLPSSELDTLLYVCKSWGYVTARLVFKDVDLKSKTKVATFNKLMKTSDKAILVESLKFHEKLKIKTHVDELALCCPNIKKLSKSLSLVFPTRIWLAFQQFKKIQVLPEPKRSERFDYERCASLCRKSLKEYYLFYVTFPYEDTLEKVKEFVQLEKLQVIGFPEMTRLIEFDKMISSLPNIKTLNISLDLPACEDILEVFLSPKPIDLSFVKPQNNIKDLKFLVAYDKYAFDYIIHKFPALQSLEATLTYPSRVSKWCGDANWTMAEIERLSDYISRIPEYTIYIYTGIESVHNFLKYRNDKALRVAVIPGDTTGDIEFEYPDIRFEKDKTSILNRRGDVTAPELLDIWRHSENIEKLIINDMNLTYDENLHSIVMDALAICQSIKTFEYTCIAPPVALNKDNRIVRNFNLEKIKIQSTAIKKDTYVSYSRAFPSLKRMKVELNNYYRRPSNLDLIGRFRCSPADLKPFGLKRSDLKQAVQEHGVYMCSTSFENLSLTFNYGIKDCCILLLVRTKPTRTKVWTIYRSNKQIITEEKIDMEKNPKMVVFIHCHSIHSLTLSQNDIFLENHVIDLK